MRPSLIMISLLLLVSGCVNNATPNVINPDDLSGIHNVTYYTMYSSPGGTETKEWNYTIDGNNIVSCNSCTVKYSSYTETILQCSELNITNCAGAIYPEDITNIAKTMQSPCPFNFTKDRKCFFGTINDEARQDGPFEALICMNNNVIVNYQEQGVRPSMRWGIDDYSEYINWQDIPEWYYKECS